MYLGMWPLHSNWMNVAAMTLVGFAIVMRTAMWKDQWKRFNIPWSWAVLALIGGYLFLLGHNAWIYVEGNFHEPLRDELLLREWELSEQASSNRVAVFLADEVVFNNPNKLFDFNLYGAATLKEVLIGTLDYVVKDETAEPNEELERVQERLNEIPRTYAFIEGWWAECYLDVGFFILLGLSCWAFKDVEEDFEGTLEWEVPEDV